jgi:hypothetical protein
MKRRKFIQNSSIITLGASILPMRVMTSPLLIPAELHVFSQETWFLKALTTFAKYSALDKLAEHTWDYLFDKLTGDEPEKPVVEEATNMMKGGGFSNFKHSPVYQNNYYGTILYDAANKDTVKDVCVGVTRKGRGASTPLMLDGPAIGMIGFTAQSAAEKGYSPAQIRSMLFPSGDVHQGSTGNLKTGYSSPIVYDTKEGYRVAMGYEVKSGLGKGELIVAEINSKTKLAQKLFEFPVT